MSFSINSNNKNDQKCKALTSSNTKILKNPHEFKEETKTCLVAKQPNTKKLYNEGDRFIPNRLNNEQGNREMFILQNKVLPKDVKSNKSNNNSNFPSSNDFQSTDAQGDSDATLQYQNYLFDSYMAQSSICEANPNMSVNYSHNDSIHSRERVLSFHSKTKTIPNFMSSLKSLIEKNNNQVITKKVNRYIASVPEKVLDAPNMSRDYYLNLIDWAPTNLLAVCLDNSVYLWNSITSDTNLLLEHSESITSVSWSNSGTCLAIGLPNGSVELWDINKMTSIRNMKGHSKRVGSLSWNPGMNLLSSGSKDSRILNHDVRERKHVVNCLLGHSQEVCGLKWSPEGNLLASGGNDNLLCIWDINTSNRINTGSNNNLLTNGMNTEIGNNILGRDQSLHNGDNNLIPNFNQNINRLNASVSNRNNILMSVINEDRTNFLMNDIPPQYLLNQQDHPKVTYYSPKFKITQHKAGVKAIAWCPWQKGLLATGGGSKDRTIKFWNTDSGSLIKSFETNSQVTSLIWNEFDKEIISSHGYSKNQITVWNYPEMTKITELFGHSERILNMSLSPDKTTIVSASGDETLRFWKVFQSKPGEKAIADQNKGKTATFGSNLQLR